MVDTDRRDVLKASALLSTGVAVSLAGCTGDDDDSSPSDGDDSSSGDNGDGVETLVVASPAENTTLDPRDMAIGTELSWKFLLYNSFTKLTYSESDGFQFEPDLAESNEWTDDGDEAVLQFELREDVQFHNGDDLTAELAKTEIDYWRNPDNNSAQRQIVNPIIETSVDDDYTLNLHFEEVFAPAEVYFSRYVTIANPHVREERGASEFALNPSGGGTGPYELENFQQGDRMEMVAYDDYHEDGLPHFQEAELRILPEQGTRTAQLRGGDIHIDNEVNTQAWQSLQDNDEVETDSQPAAAYAFSALNHKVEPLGDKRIRKALSKATNRDEFIQAQYRGEATNVTLPHLPGSWWHWSDLDGILEYDPDEATTLLEDAGYGDGFEIDMYSPPQYSTMAEVLQDQWQEIGVEVNIERIEHGTMYSNIVEEQHEMHAAQFSSNPDPDYFIYSCTNPDGNWRTFANGWEHEEFDTLVEEARTTADQDERDQLYQEILEIWADEVPTLVYAVADNLAAWRHEIDGYWVSNDLLGREAFRDVSWNP